MSSSGTILAQVVSPAVTADPMALSKASSRSERLSSVPSMTVSSVLNIDASLTWQKGNVKSSARFKTSSEVIISSLLIVDSSLSML